MSDYRGVRIGKLKIKGQKDSSTARSDKKRKRKHEDSAGSAEQQDIAAHAGWWSVTEDCQLRKGGPVAIETWPNSYLMSMDNGKFTLGAPHGPGETPAPEEVLTLIKTPDTQWVSLKSGYGKYLGVNSEGQIVATGEAIGAREKWELVFQEGKVALQNLSNSCFLSFETDQEGYVYACQMQARENEMIKLRTSIEKAKPEDWTPADDKKSAKECETAYIKMYQHSKVDLKNRCVSINPKDRAAVREGRAHGDLHENLLDRRVKMKSDRYC